MAVPLLSSISFWTERRTHSFLEREIHREILVSHLLFFNFNQQAYPFICLFLSSLSFQLLLIIRYYALIHRGCKNSFTLFSPIFLSSSNADALLGFPISPLLCNLVSFTPFFWFSSVFECWDFILRSLRFYLISSSFTHMGLY